MCQHARAWFGLQHGANNSCKLTCFTKTRSRTKKHPSDVKNTHHNAVPRIASRTPVEAKEQLQKILAATNIDRKWGHESNPVLLSSSDGRGIVA